MHGRGPLMLTLSPNRLRHQGAGYGSRRNESKRVPYPSPPTQRDSSCPLPGSALERKVEEMQVSLNLIGLQQKRSDGINQLTSALLVCCASLSVAASIC